eukprot:PLAT8557.1.p2 GENE.PLAT8557.1~~PLAT8557.1.p2  ORF type:complete len:152 (+),score=60.53 PLAT8557.1:304-759(+)
MALSADTARQLLQQHGKWVKGFNYTFLVLSLLNCLARADPTVVICMLGFHAIWTQRKNYAWLYGVTLAASWILDIAWVSVHGSYLQDFGAIPDDAATSIKNLIRLHKWSLGISIVELMAKFFSFYFVYHFWRALTPDAKGGLADEDGNRRL